MKKAIQCFIGLGFILMLSGCAPKYTTEYSYVAPDTPAVKACVNQCRPSRTACRRMCVSGNKGCIQQAKDHAMARFHQYQADRQANGYPVDKTPDDFLNESSCFQSCGCEVDYRACFQLCGGHAVPHKVCVKFCDTREIDN